MFRLLAGLGALTAIVGSASADTLNLRHSGNGNGRLVRISLGSQTWQTFAGRVIHQKTNATGGLGGLPASLVAFSTDILRGNPSTATTYNNVGVAYLSGNDGHTNLGFAKQQAIYDIFAAAAGNQFNLGHDYATAFQVALWEIVYDFNPNAPDKGLNFASGNFRASDADGNALSNSIRTKIEFLLGSVGSGASPQLIYGFRADGFADYVTMIAPLPTPVLLGLAGLGLAAVARRRLSSR